MRVQVGEVSVLVVVVLALEVHFDIRAARFLGFEVVGTGGCRYHDQTVAAVGRLGYGEEDAEHEDAEEDRADAERPAVPVVLDDVTADERTACDTAEEEEVPDGDPCGAFVLRGC